VKRKQPQASVMLEIPDCRMEASVTRDREIIVQLGWPHDRTTLVFKRRALRRLARLAADVLAAPSPDGQTGGHSEIVSTPD
jgi:hypothetical protein